MTISSTTNRVNYTGNGVTTAFAFPYKFLANADLKVYQEGTLKTITTHYTVTGAGDDAGGTVTFLVAPANLDDVVIIRDPAILQGLDLVENDNLPAESLENSFDLITMVAQRLDDRISRAFVLNDADVSGPDLTIPSPVADEIIGWNSAGDALESKAVALLGAVSIPVSIAQGGTESATAADARSALGLAIGTDVQAYDADIATVAASQVEMEAGTEVALRSMSPLRISQAIAALSSGSADQVARDQIALTNMRLLLNSSVASGALYAGYQWELATDEWAASSSGEAYTAGTPAYYTGVVSEYTPTGSTFGDMTTNGGLAASFDGNISQASVACSTKVTATSGYVGKAFSSAQKISRVDTYGANEVGYAHATGGSVTINIYGKSSSPANATDGTLIGTSGSFTDGATAQLKQITCDPTTDYQYVWAVINASSQNLFMAEVKYFTTSDVTLIPPASTSVSTDPTYMDAYFLWKDDSGSAVIGTDLTVELSRDNGTTYTTATLTNLASYDGTYSIIKARANVSAQPSGTSMLCRIKMLNSKLQRVAAPALYSE